MHASVLEIELRIPAVQSLKGKRRVLRRLLARLGSDQVAVSEVGLHDAWQRSLVGVGVVAESEGRLAELVEGVKRIFDAEPEIEVVMISIDRLEPE